MKKFKSLLSLMLVMILMLSLAGPMAFAATAVTVTAQTPTFSTVTNGWKADYTISPADLETDYEFKVEVDVAVNGEKITATPKVTKVTDKATGDDVTDNFSVKVVKATETRPSISVKATEPTYYNGAYISTFELASGELLSGHSFSGRPSISVDGNTVIASSANVKIINGDGKEVTGKYNITKTINATRDVSGNKANITVKAATPRLNAEGKWVCDGVAEKYATVNVDDKDYNVAVLAEGVITDNGSTVTGSLKNIRVVAYVNATEIDLTSRVNVTTETSSTTKPVLTINVNAPVYNGTKYVQNFYGYKFNVEQFSVGGNLEYVSDFTVTVNSGDIVVTDNGAKPTATVSTDKVLVEFNGQNISKGFNIVVNPGVHTKETIHVYPNPANKDSNGNFSHDGFSSNVGAVAPGHWVQVIDWNISSSGAITPLTVKVYDGDNDNMDVTAYFNVVKHTTNYDGTTTTPDNGNNTNTTKTNLVITAVDAEKAYNGYSFSATQARGVKVTGLQSGHKLNADVLKMQYTRRSDNTIFTEYTSVVKVGTYDKTLIVPQSNVVLDGAGNDVTSQYNISTVDGILTIYNSGWVSPDTGDHSNIGLWIVLLAVSAVAVGAVVFVVLKKGKKA